MRCTLLKLLFVEDWLLMCAISVVSMRASSSTSIVVAVVVATVVLAPVAVVL